MTRGSREHEDLLAGSWRCDRNGWTYVHVEGAAFARGYQHGWWAARDIGEVLRCLRFLAYWNTGHPWEFFVRNASELFASKLGEYQPEIAGIAEGATAHGTPVSFEEILAWNGYEELVDYWLPHAQGQKADPLGECSAFVATGAYTAGGIVVMGHNSWSDFETGQFNNYVLDIVPTDGGGRVFMQSLPGYVHSFSDFFVTQAGLMGTETTIGGFNAYDAGGVPEFVRVRRAMQYSTRLDDFVGIMLDGNNGGYANTWLLADQKTREIMRFELGLKYHSVDRTTDGYYIGFNAAYDPRIRNLECSSNNGFADVRRHQGARLVRLKELIEEHRSKITADVGMKIMGDHCDVYLRQMDPSDREKFEEHPCSRTVCGHYELDAREYMCQPGRPLPYQPRGTVDGKVMDGDQAAKLEFWARWGSSCGSEFVAKALLDEHPQWSYLRPYLHDRPSQPWTRFRAGIKP